MNLDPLGHLGRKVEHTCSELDSASDSMERARELVREIERETLKMVSQMASQIKYLNARVAVLEAEERARLKAGQLVTFPQPLGPDNQYLTEPEN